MSHFSFLFEVNAWAGQPELFCSTHERTSLSTDRIHETPVSIFDLETGMTAGSRARFIGRTMDKLTADKRTHLSRARTPSFGGPLSLFGTSLPGQSLIFFCRQGLFVSNALFPFVELHGRYLSTTFFALLRFTALTTRFLAYLTTSPERATMLPETQRPAPRTPSPQPRSLLTPPRQPAGKRKRGSSVHEDDELTTSPLKHARRPLFSYSCSPNSSDLSACSSDMPWEPLPTTPLLPSLPVFEGKRPRSSPMVRSPGMASMSKFTQAAYAEEEADMKEDEVGALRLAELDEALWTSSPTPPPGMGNSCDLLSPATPELSHSPSSSSSSYSGTSSLMRSPRDAQVTAGSSSSGCPGTPSPVSRFASTRRWRPSPTEGSAYDAISMIGVLPPSPPVRRVWGEELQLWHSTMSPPKYEVRPGPGNVKRRPSLQGLENGLWSRDVTGIAGQDDCSGLGLGLRLAF